MAVRLSQERLRIVGDDEVPDVADVVASLRRVAAPVAPDRARTILSLRTCTSSTAESRSRAGTMTRTTSWKPRSPAMRTLP